MLAQSEMPRYTIHRVETLPNVNAAWNSPAWSEAETLTIARFHPRGSDHKPVTQARILHDGRTIAVMFRVEDQYIVARNTEYQSPTHKDSCVEFFVKPLADRGYFNFEFNVVGALLLWYVEQPRGPDGVFGKYTEVPKETVAQIEVATTFSGPIREELVGSQAWTVSYSVPLELFERYTGPLGDPSGQTWSANFYKCADDSSHPHWGYWADIGDRLDFHQPDRFGEIVFE